MISSLILDFGSAFQLILKHTDPIDKWTHLNKMSKAVIFNGEEYDLGLEALGSILSDVKNSCDNIIDNESELHDYFKNIGIGFYYNIYNYTLRDDTNIDNILPYLENDLSINNHLTDGNGLIIFCYTIEMKAYIEVGRIYPDFEKINLRDFKDWLQSYKSIGRVQISREKIIEVKNRIDSFKRAH